MDITSRRKQTGKATSEKVKQLWHDFFQKLLEMSKEKIDLDFNDKNLKYYKIQTFPDALGNRYCYTITVKRGLVELNNYHKDKEKAIFEWLKLRKDKIEKDFGGGLDWRRNDNKRNWRIVNILEEGSLHNKESWPNLQKNMVTAMSRIHDVLSPHLKDFFC